MGWIFMIANLAATILIYGAGPEYAFFLAFAMLAANFATFCLLYDDPIKRARNRIDQRLAQIPARGLHGEEHQRMQSMKVVATAEDKKFQLTFLSGLNIASGLGGAAMLLWAIALRMG